MKCPVCNKTYQRETAYWKHLRRFHSTHYNNEKTKDAISRCTFRIAELTNKIAEAEVYFKFLNTNPNILLGKLVMDELSKYPFRYDPNVSNSSYFFNTEAKAIENLTQSKDKLQEELIGHEGEAK